MFAGKIIRILKKENPFEIYAGNWIVVVVVVVVLYGFIDNKNNKSLNRQYNYLSKNNMKINSLSSIQSKMLKTLPNTINIFDRSGFKVQDHFTAEHLVAMWSHPWNLC